MFQHQPRVEITLNYCHNLAVIPEIEAPEGCEIRRIGFDELPLLRDVWPVSIKEMVKRLQHGDQCYSAFLQGRIAHYQWVQMHGKHHIQPANRCIELNTSELVFFHSRVSDWARGRRIYPYVNCYLLNQYKQEGFTAAWIYTTIGNLASQKGIERAGWEFNEGYRSLVWGTVHIPLPGKITSKPILT